MRLKTPPQYTSGLFYSLPGGRLDAVRHCGEHQFIRGHRVAPHAHTGFEFIYLSRGAATRIAGNESTRQHMGDLYVTYPREFHYVQCEPADEGRQIQIGLHLNKLGPAGRRLARSLRRYKVRLLHHCPPVEPVLQGILWQISANPPNRDEVVLAHLQTFCALVEQAVQRAVDRKNRKAALPYSFPIQEAVFFLGQNLDRRVPLREIAAAAGVANIHRFCTTFHREVKATPSAYHLSLRLDAARRALLQPMRDMTSVAMQFGFGSSQHFSTAFRRTFGQAPRAWKKLATS